MDCSGKSSIANYIKNVIPEYILEHCDPPKNFNDGKLQYENIVNNLNNKNYLLFDRALLGECIYAPIFRNYYPDYMRELESKINNNTYLFLITADVNTVKKRFDGKFIKEDQIEKIINDYYKEFNLSNYKNKFIIDTSNITVEEAVNKILEKLK